MSDLSVAHKGEMNHFGAEKWPDGLVPWRPATPPNLQAPYPESQYCTTGRLRSCGYCGSMHPSDLVAALKAGARVHWADQKYGWPHKIYVEDIPNPHVGMLESRMGCSHATAFCPAKGAPCEHGEQSAYRPPADCCMTTRPHDVATGTSSGRPVVLKQNGFDQSTGKPTYTWRDPGEPAKATTDGKFYSRHLLDATPEEREVIERAMRRSFLWHEGKLWYGPYTEGGLTWEKVQEGLRRQEQQDAALPGAA